MRFGALILFIGVLVVLLVPVHQRIRAQQDPQTTGAAAVKQRTTKASANLSRSPGSDRTPLARITIDYPAEGSIFPPEITAPVFLWRDSSESAELWHVEIAFADGLASLHSESWGERMRVGEIDPRCVSDTNELPRLTPQQVTARSWTPNAEIWAAIKKRSLERPATVTITGFRNSKPDQPISRGRVTIQTSRDPVGAPIFYRDVPLMPSELQRGVIKPLAKAVFPLVAWRLRNVGESSSRVVMEDLYTCANCHSFSRDGKTLGMELDSAQNDKRTYAIASIEPQMSIRNADVITWNSLPPSSPDHKTLAFMPRLSPDGQYAVATVNEAMYVANFKDYRFLQVFYPTRGILAWYSRATGRTQVLPGADDPRYVHTNAVWTPDGRTLIFARAEAKDPYPKGRKLAEFANDPNEVPIQYDLYRIPFNGGKGGRPERIAGASRNGMSNSFPKVSPDGRWIVFVQCRNGQLMRPDSKLYIVPAEGGEARRMRCNTPLMNSWHSFSPNGRWLVFSSKSRSPYTQMFLTHLDEHGRDSPAILIENATAANRAVNIPEFLNIPPDGLSKIEVPAVEFYRLFDRAWELAESGHYEDAVTEWGKALEINPDDPKAHINFGVALLRQGKLDQAMAHWRKAIDMDSASAEAHNNLAAALVRKGNLDEAITHWRKALEVMPESAEPHYNLGVALVRKGRLDEAITHWRRALEANPNYAEAHNELGAGLFGKGNTDEALAHFRKAVEVKPDFAEAFYNLGRALALKGWLDEAIEQYQRALEINSGYAEAHNSFGVALARRGRLDEAIKHWRKALEIKPDYKEAHINLGRALPGN